MKYNLEEYEKEALLDMPDGTLKVLIDVIKDMMCNMPMHKIDIYSVSEKVLELYQEEIFGEIWNYYPNGRLYKGDCFETENDIVSEWQDEINEEKLDELAESESEERFGGFSEYFIDGFKNGYRKAKEQQCQ